MSVQPAEKISWPLVWLLTRYSRRFVLLPPTGPSREKIMENLRSYESKLAWRILLHDNPGLRSLE